MCPIYAFMCVNYIFMLFIGQVGYPRILSMDIRGYPWESMNIHGHRIFMCFPEKCSLKLGGIDAQSMPGHFRSSVS